MSYQISGLRQAKKVVKLAGKVIDPQIDVEKMVLPNKDQLRKMMIKLDLLHCDVQRHFCVSTGPSMFCFE